MQNHDIVLRRGGAGKGDAHRARHRPGSHEASTRSLVSTRSAGQQGQASDFCSARTGSAATCTASNSASVAAGVSRTLSNASNQSAWQRTQRSTTTSPWHRMRRRTRVRSRATWPSGSCTSTPAQTCAVRRARPDRGRPGCTRRGHRNRPWSAGPVCPRASSRLAMPAGNRTLFMATCRANRSHEAVENHYRHGLGGTQSAVAGTGAAGSVGHAHPLRRQPRFRGTLRTVAARTGLSGASRQS